MEHKLFPSSLLLFYMCTVLTGYIIAQEQQRGPNERIRQAIFIISCCCYFLNSNVYNIIVEGLQGETVRRCRRRDVSLLYFEKIDFLFSYIKVMVIEFVSVHSAVIYSELNGLNALTYSILYKKYKRLNS